MEKILISVGLVRGDLLSLAGALFMLVCVLFLAYWCSKFLGHGLSRVSEGRNMRVIERIGLGTNKQLLLLKIKDSTYLIGVSQSGIQMLAELEGEFEAPPSSGTKVFPAGFEEILKKYAAKLGKDKEKSDG